MKVTEDVGVPLGVTVAMIATRNNTTTILGQPMQDAVAYGLALAGYALPMLGIMKRHEELLTKLGIASLPLAAIKLYNKYGTPSATPGIFNRASAPISMRRVSRYPAPAAETPFQGVRLV